MSETKQRPQTLNAIFSELREATHRSQIERIIRELIKNYNADWRLVGDRSNFPTIHITSSAISSIMERVTNAIDAQLEADATFWPKMIQNCKSPRQLVETRYHVKGGYLSSLEDKKGKKAGLVKETGIKITLRDGDSEERPTIEITDKGIGVGRDEFPKTLLSLNENNKINKWYLMGRFGQGGSTTFRFSEYTIIVSRRRRSFKSLEDHISFTIVKYREAKEGEKDGQYVYLVQKSDNLPFYVSASDIEFGGGTLVRHVNYSLGKKYFLLDIYGFLKLTYLIQFYLFG